MCFGGTLNLTLLDSNQLRDLGLIVGFLKNALFEFAEHLQAGALWAC